MSETNSMRQLDALAQALTLLDMRHSLEETGEIFIVKSNDISRH
jgi:hypothetical protein